MNSKRIALDFAVIALMLTEPFANFVYVRGLVFELVTATVLAVYLACALLIALLINRYPNRTLRAIVLTALITLFLDVRVNIFALLGLEGLLIVGGCLAAIWLLYLNAAKVLLAAFVVIFAFNVTQPVFPTVREDRTADQPNKAAHDGLPVFVHLVLDEFIGVEGLDDRIAEQKKLKQDIKKLFVDNGFRLFGRAYSEHNRTVNTLSAGLNDYAGADPSPFYEYDEADNENTLLTNAYFERRLSDGYRIRVLQSTFFDFCSSRSAVGKCTTYKVDGVTSDALALLNTAEQFDLILSVFWHKSFLKSIVHRLYAYSEAIAKTLGVELPHWPFISDLSAGQLQQLPIFDRLVADIAGAPNGNMYFAHLMMPHHPYSFDARCNIRRPLMDWDRPFTLTALPDGRQNTEQSRAQRYAAYVDQVQCSLTKISELFEAMRSAGIYDNATIVIHGDHGSRIAQFRPLVANKDRLTPADFYDGYSILFAVKAPHVVAGYDRRMLPLQYLLRLAEGRQPDIGEFGEGHFVYLLEHPADVSLVKVPMPEIPDTSVRSPIDAN